MLERLPFTAANAPSRAAALLRSFQERLEESQRWSPEAIRTYQLRKLANLSEHAWRTIPFHRERLAAAGFRPGEGLTPDCWSRLAHLTRRDIRALGARLHADELPEDHGRTYHVHTSGSTGAPITTLATTLTLSLHDAIALREHLWHGREFARKFATIASFPEDEAVYPDGALDRSWGEERILPFATGPAARLNASADADQQIAWLQRQAPSYLLTSPSNLIELAERCRQRRVAFRGLLEIITIGEVLPAELRDACRAAWNVPVVDMYAAEEVGYVALQCPDRGGYHIQSEVILAEILDEAGHPCRPGEIGRVTVTPLFNYAMPLLRYEIGDYAEAGDICGCGRGLPTLRRVMGRQRNALILPNGARYWPNFDSGKLGEIAPILQHQFVQTALDRIEARLVVAKPLTEEQESRMRALLLSCLPGPLRLDFAYWAELPVKPGGKCENFISELAAVRSLALVS